MLSAYVIAHPAVSLVSTADRRSKITACASCFAGLHESPSFRAGETWFLTWGSETLPMVTVDGFQGNHEPL